ncbi:MAG: beta-galactosidase [Clostridiales bacterium]|jgi:hypothetical protein|nr:beta-galactosidase [Clostridiales bacterium]
MIGYNERYLTKNGKPWFPVMGEIHYSRLPRDEWRDALLKMKAGGVSIASSYIIWIHHEEIEGVWESEGNLDLRAFIKTAGECGLLVFLRIGPWAHGEVRNGGFPDWLLKKDFEPRTNDSRYFAVVEKLFKRIAEEAKGLLWQDGGPVIGIQIENEYGHCGGLTGEAGELHMKKLAEIARDCGLEAPLVTATGWGGAIVGGLLPVMGGYCEAPWDSRLTEIEPSGNFLFSQERNDHDIGSDYPQGEHLTFDQNLYPFLTAELGGGLQVTDHRRPVAAGQDAAAMSIAKLGSGAAMLGYYMYHGGVNPEGKLSTFQESKATGSPNDLPVKSYDFRAPLGGSGQVNSSFYELRRIAMFLADFGEDLNTMDVFLPPENPTDPADFAHFRHSVRTDGSRGYIFFNNYSRRKMPYFEGVSISVNGRALPKFDVRPGKYGFYPFNMPVKGGTILFAEASPLCRIGSTTILYGNNIVALGDPDILAISPEDSLKACKLRMGGERLAICNGLIVEDYTGSFILAEDNITLKLYPAPAKHPAGFDLIGDEGSFTVYKKVLPKDQASCETNKKGEGSYQLSFQSIDPLAYDYALRIKYRANKAKALLGGKLVYDDFYADGNWHIGLKRLGYPEALDIELEPLLKSTPVYLDAWPELENGYANSIDEVAVSRVWKVPLSF